MKKYIIPSLLLVLFPECASPFLLDKNSIFPNPTEGMVTVDFSEVQTGKLLVTDITGKVILDRLVNAEKSLTLDLSANRSGLYVIKCIFSDATLTARVLLK